MGKIAFLCSGQGAQKVGMGVDFALKSESCAEIFDVASAASGTDIYQLCMGGPIEELSRTELTQPALVATSLAIATALRERGIEPDCVAGFSLGEYAAHAIAGTVSVEVALQLVSRRGAMMAYAASQNEGGMAALLRCDLKQAAELCKKHADETGQVLAPANINCPGQIVISGQKPALDAACEDWKAQGGKAKVLRTSGAFHTPLMQVAADRMKPALRMTGFLNPEIPLYCNYNALPLEPGKAPEMLYKQITSPVLWEDTIRNMISDGVDTFIECGPGKVLTKMVKHTARAMEADVKRISVGTVEELEAVDV